MIKCLSNLRQLGMGFMMYANENKGYFPAAARWAPDTREEDWIWFEAPDKSHPGRPNPDPQQSRIAPYLGGFKAELFRCPSDDVMAHKDPGKLSGAYHYSYVMSDRFDAGKKKIKLTMVRKPSSKIFLVEEDENSINDGNWNPGGLGAVDRDLLGIRHDANKDPDDLRNQDLSTHKNAKKRGNAAFCDGHAEFIPRTMAHDPQTFEPAK